jgi:hypothetical protein
MLIMRLQPKPLTMSTPVTLGQVAHQFADQACQRHSDWQVAEKVYLNTLVEYAVNYYLNCLGYDSELQSVDTRNAVMQTVTDSAEIIIKQYGKIECRRVLPDTQTVYIPEETWSDRIAFIAVRLNDDLDRAEILGFLDQVETTEVPLEDLRSLFTLPTYLNQFAPAQPTHLSQWLSGIISAGWDSIQATLGEAHPELAFSFRGTDLRSVGQGKKIQLGTQTVNLVTFVKFTSTTDLQVRIALLPLVEQPFLPDSVQLKILDDQGNPVSSAQAGAEHQQMRIDFMGEAGDRFSAQVILNGTVFTEDFLI